MINWDGIDFASFIKVLIGAVSTLGVIFIGKYMDKSRFKHKDKAEVGKLTSETAVDFADIVSKHISAGVSMADSTREWAQIFIDQLKEANVIIHSKQEEIDALRASFHVMREEFEKKMNRMEKLLDSSQKELNAERIKNIELSEKLNEYIKGQ